MKTDQPAPGTPDDVEDLMDLFCYALGTGAQMRIKRDAIRWFRATFQPSLTSLVTVPDWQALWHDDAARTLEFVRTIGRLAAQRAADRGMPHVGLKVLDEAIWVVINAVTRGDDGRTLFGRPCGEVLKRETPIVSS